MQNPGLFLRKRIVYDEKEGNDTSDAEAEEKQNGKKVENVFAMPKNADQIWTDVDLAKLARLVKKYPAGTPDRWDRIAEMLERLPKEVTKMAKKIADNPSLVPISKGFQGITGLESKKVSDEVMENHFNEGTQSWLEKANLLKSSCLCLTISGSEDINEVSQEDSEGLEDSEDSDDSDDSNYGAYTVASKEEFLNQIEVKTKVKTKKFSNNVILFDR